MLGDFWKNPNAPFSNFLNVLIVYTSFCMFFFRFFFQLRVRDKDGIVLVPKKNTLAAY